MKSSSNREMVVLMGIGQHGLYLDIQETCSSLQSELDQLVSLSIRVATVLEDDKTDEVKLSLLRSQIETNITRHGLQQIARQILSDQTLPCSISSNMLSSYLANCLAGTFFAKRTSSSSYVL